MNAFDDNLKHRAGGFRIEPRKEVWERVEQELDSKKRKRRILWFWWFAPLLLAGGAIWYMQNPGTKVKNKDILPETTVTTVQKQPETIQPEEKYTLPVQDTKNEQSGIDARNIKNISTQHATPFTPSFSGRGTVSMKRPPENVSPRPEENTLTPAGENQGIEGAGNDRLQTSGNKSMAAMVVISADTLPKQSMGDESNTLVVNGAGDSINQAMVISEAEKTAIRDTQPVVSPKPSALKKEKKPTKGRWYLLAGTGIHNHTGKGIGLQKSMADYNSGLSNNAGGGQGSAFQPLESPEPGAGFMLGVERTQPFGRSKHWSWTGGLHYQYQSFNISTGALKDSALSYSTDRGNVTTSGFYRAGNIEQQKGSQHRAHLLAAVQWHFDKKQRWTWQNGFYGGLILSSDYLIPQRAPLGWVSSKGLTQKGYTGIETGFIFRPSQWGAGIFGQYNLSNSLNVSGPAPQYWRGVELRIQYKLSAKTLKK